MLFRSVFIRVGTTLYKVVDQPTINGGKVRKRIPWNMETLRQDYGKEFIKYVHKYGALTGIITAFKEERNMRKHLVSAILVVLAGLIFRVSATEWLFLLMAVFLVIALEIVNSAIENVVDLASNYHFSMLAKNAKDMAAGAVLVVSCYALITGMIVFIPKIWHLIFN